MDRLRRSISSGKWRSPTAGVKKDPLALREGVYFKKEGSPAVVRFFERRDGVCYRYYNTFWGVCQGVYNKNVLGFVQPLMVGRLLPRTDITSRY